MFEHDLGQYVKGVLGAAPVTAVADSVTDNVAVEGVTLNRLQTATGDIARSCVVLVPYTTTLSATETMSLAVMVQDSADGSVWSAAETLLASAEQASGGVAGATVTGIIELNDDLNSRRQYVRYNVTPNLSQSDIAADPEAEPPVEAAEATDAVTFATVVVLGGYKNLTV
jgi:hypothetical protein